MNPMSNGSRGANESAPGVGAVVVGGDFHGLGIVRSLGRRGIPICVIDDEYSIGRFSRYTTHAVTASSLRKEEEIADVLLKTARRLNLKGWVLFATRDEIVVAGRRFRCQLGQAVPVTTPAQER